MPNKNKGTRKERRQLRRTKEATRQALLDNMAAQEYGFYEAVDPVVYKYDNSRSYVTDEFGCGVITVETYNAPGGTFAYSVNSINVETKVVVDSEGGLAYVPEMGIVGAIAALAGAGFMVAKKRKE